MVGNQRTPMKDMAIILPGILGSVLQKDGNDLWNVSGQAIWQIVKNAIAHFCVSIDANL